METKDYSKYFMPNMQDARKRINRYTNVYKFTLDEEYKKLGQNRFYYIKTYGCQGNNADSEKIAGILEAMGYQETAEIEKANVLLLNTCAIRENAEMRVFGELGRLKGLKVKNKDLLIGVCGCMPQEENVVKTLYEKFPYVDLVFGTHNIHKLPQYLRDAYFSQDRVIEVYSQEGDIVEEIPMKREHQVKAWVNIMYGCDEFCTYCIVPYTRGKERSRRPEDIISEVKELIDLGYQEVTLLGQNVNAYGKDFDDKEYTFADLLADLNKLPISRIRFTTSHPRDLDDRTIEVMSRGGNIMPHLHLPVQSGSNTVLKRMNRKYTKEEYVEKVKKLKQAVPGISITTDIIVGFQGETNEDFEKTLELVKECEFEGAFTFIFSPREGTPASRYEDSTPMEEKKKRLYRLNEIVNEGYLKGNKRFEGEVVEVLVEGKSDKNPNLLTGYTPHNKLVNFIGDEFLIGKIVKVKIDKAFTWHLRGKIVS
ncbi:MAG TPA: tRNA (N6-isopentenyl adenosine(37)-C2)-methylthiotransferase MiaB [Bacilli bacterium]|nr:tRNA (N6-isopentenyl adenosine(37)-C2)-methylthiotransferase MiaB [Bacilli bacterium]